MTARKTELLRLAFWLNISFAALELVGGWWIGSLAILSDAFHDFGDSISLGLAWFFQRLSQKKSDEKYSFGYARFSTLGAFINSTILIIGSIFLVYTSLINFEDHALPKTGWMIAISVLGIAVNGVAFKTLHAGTSLNEKTAAFHLLEDVLGWIAVLVGAGVMYFTDWAWIDPALSLIIAGWIGFNAVKSFVKASKVFLQQVPEDIDLDEVSEKLKSDDRVKDIHDVRIWSLDGSEHIVSIHVVLNHDARLSEVDQIRIELKQVLKEMGIHEVTLQFESPLLNSENSK